MHIESTNAGRSTYKRVARICRTQYTGQRGRWKGRALNEGEG